LSSLKPSNVEVKQCELMFGLTYEQIVQAREKEELYQFVQRTKLRDYKSDEVVDIYVFDKEQALSLSDTPIFIDLGIEVTNSAKSVSTFVPLNLSTSQKKAYQRISLEHFPTIELFNKWMNKEAQLVLNEQQRA
ncbi:type III restriction endonuclease subunit R, partial [Enterobacter cloacae complex sp. 4DZ1-17B1]